jgi:hypothetical protein
MGTNVNSLNQEHTIRFYLLPISFTVTLLSATRAQKYSLLFTLGLELYLLYFIGQISRTTCVGFVSIIASDNSYIPVHMNVITRSSVAIRAP